MLRWLQRWFRRATLAGLRGRLRRAEEWAAAFDEKWEKLGDLWEASEAKWVADSEDQDAEISRLTWRLESFMRFFEELSGTPCEIGWGPPVLVARAAPPPDWSKAGNPTEVRHYDVPDPPSVPPAPGPDADQLAPEDHAALAASRPPGHRAEYPPPPQAPAG